MVRLYEIEKETQMLLLQLKSSTEKRAEVHADSLRRLNAKMFGVAEVSVKYMADEQPKPQEQKE